MKQNSLPSWIFKTVGHDIETTVDMSVMALVTGEGINDDYHPLFIKGGAFFELDGRHFTGIVYGYAPCPAPVFPDLRPVCIFRDTNTGLVVDAGRFPLRPNSDGVVFGDKSYHINGVNCYGDAATWVSVESFAAKRQTEQWRSEEDQKARIQRKAEDSARKFVESKAAEIQAVVDARVEALRELRNQIHPSYQDFFDSELLLMKVRRSRITGLVRDVMCERDLFASLSVHLDANEERIENFVAKSERRFARDAWRADVEKDNGELISLREAADECGMKHAAYRRQVQNNGVTIHKCPILWGGVGGANCYVAKADAKKLKLGQR